MPPTRASSVSYAKPRLPNQPSTRRVASITSGPMPSPGRVRILNMRSNPGRLSFVVFFVGRNLVFAAQGQPDIIPAIEQALLAEGINIELDHAAIGAANFLGLQIDAEAGIGAALGIVHQLVHIRLRQDDGQ